MAFLSYIIQEQIVNLKNVDNVETARKRVQVNPNLSVRHHSQQLNLDQL